MKTSRLSPSGHIPLNEETMSGMHSTERAFWEDFLPRVMETINEKRDSDATLPYEFPPELLPDFQTAINVYAGDKYCQISQIRKMFSFGPTQ
jgi:hypothetical protein